MSSFTVFEAVVFVRIACFAISPIVRRSFGAFSSALITFPTLSIRLARPLSGAAIVLPRPSLLEYIT